MGVGLPCAIGAKLAKPDAQVIALHGDGSLGMNVMELDTAVPARRSPPHRGESQRRVDGGP